MPFSYAQTFSPAFPHLPVVVALPESGARSPALSGLNEANRLRVDWSSALD